MTGCTSPIPARHNPSRCVTCDVRLDRHPCGACAGVEPRLLERAGGCSACGRGQDREGSAA